MSESNVKAYQSAKMGYMKKEKWSDLTTHEIEVLQTELHSVGLVKELVFKDRLDLIKCILFHAGALY